MNKHSAPAARAWRVYYDLGNCVCARVRSDAFAANNAITKYGFTLPTYGSLPRAATGLQKPQADERRFGDVRTAVRDILYDARTGVAVGRLNRLHRCMLDMIVAWVESRVGQCASMRPGPLKLNLSEALLKAAACDDFEVARLAFAFGSRKCGQALQIAVANSSMDVITEICEQSLARINVLELLCALRFAVLRKALLPAEKILAATMWPAADRNVATLRGVAPLYVKIAKLAIINGDDNFAHKVLSEFRLNISSRFDPRHIINLTAFAAAGGCYSCLEYLGVFDTDVPVVAILAGRALDAQHLAKNREISWMSRHAAAVKGSVPLVQTPRV